MVFLHCHCQCCLESKYRLCPEPSICGWYHLMNGLSILRTTTKHDANMQVKMLLSHGSETKVGQHPLLLNGSPINDIDCINYLEMLAYDLLTYLGL